MKKTILTTSLLLLLTAVLTTVTVALFTSENHVDNVITTGGIDIRINGLLDNGVNGHGNLKPGDLSEKSVTVENIGNNDAYVRVSVALEWANGELSNDVIVPNYDTENWINRGGYWYYNQCLKAGEETPVLFDSVSFSSEAGNSYMNAMLNVTVEASAIQAANGAAADEWGFTPGE